MIANPGEFKAIIIKKDGSDTTGTFINNKVAHSSSEIVHLGLTIDNKLNLKMHIARLWVEWF